MAFIGLIIVAQATSSSIIWTNTTTIITYTNQSVSTIADTGTSSNSNNQPQDYSYLVFTDGTVVYVKNGETGEVQSDINASKILTNTISNMNGGTIYIKSGTYSISSPITLKNGIEIIGEGKSSLLVATNSNAIFQTENTQTEHITIKNLGFSGSQGKGIYATNLEVYNSNFKIIDNAFYADLEYGIYCNCILSTIEGNIFGYFGTPGSISKHIYMKGTLWQGTNQNFIINNRFYNSRGDSVYIETGYKIFVQDNDFELNQGIPITYKGMFATYTENNWFEGNTGQYTVQWTDDNINSIGNYVNYLKGNFFHTATGNTAFFNPVGTAKLDIEFNQFTGANIPISQDDSHIRAWYGNWYPQNQTAHPITRGV